jgi:hypothetical protein
MASAKPSAQSAAMTVSSGAIHRIVRPADRQPHPHAARDRDHRRRSAAITAAARSAGTDAGMRTRDAPENSISIAGNDEPSAAPERAA